MGMAGCTRPLLRRRFSVLTRSDRVLSGRVLVSWRAGTTTPARRRFAARGTCEGAPVLPPDVGVTSLRRVSPSASSVAPARGSVDQTHAVSSRSPTQDGAVSARRHSAPRGPVSRQRAAAHQAVSAPN